MAYIWENYSSDKTFICSKVVCPYMEVWNENAINEKAIEVNHLIRFGELFGALHNSEISAYLGKCDALDNILFHFLAQLDKCKGMNYNQSLIEKTREDITLGYYGDIAKQLWNSMNVQDQEIILYEMVQRQLNDYDCFFMEAICKLFPLASLCYEKMKNTYFLYLAVQNNKYNCKKLSLITHLFWNKNKKLFPVWEYHYGIIGNPETMHIGKIQLV